MSNDPSGCTILGVGVNPQEFCPLDTDVLKEATGPPRVFTGDNVDPGECVQGPR